MNNTWRVMTTKSDAEPWWFFEGWKKDIVQEWTFNNRDEATERFLEEMRRLSKSYRKSKSKRLHSIAFWNPGEEFFCEACDDDLQVYYGLIIFEGDQPMEINNKSIIDEIAERIPQE
ncbi:DUF1033 family protein [Rossellomorea aquimaris]|uniref:DUF1033 family protein n=1 Tax=Rossellomorea aquimaris TaxID=189382 RepID=A0A366F0H3_9BACI|nr:DUF1033 family protein [Rossellomorea aquimaris]RBP08127.1 hypothetical protein DET59_101502 [Rossellomorea aquimaris]